MRRALTILTAIAATLALAPFAAAHGHRAGPLRIGHPWARPALAGRAGGGYLTITNTGRTSDTLTGASSPLAARVTIHEMSMQGAVMRMRPLRAVDIKPGATVRFEPGGYHLMLEGLKRELKIGDRVPGVLTFARAGRVPVEFVVQAAPSEAPAMDHMGHM